jgi:hypothetical protein
MTNKERLLTLIREGYGEDIAHTDRLTRVYSQIAAARDQSRRSDVMRLWDVADLEIASFEKQYARFDQEYFALLEVTPPEEFTEAEHAEMKTLMETGIELCQRILEQLKELRLLPPKEGAPLT